MLGCFLSGNIGFTTCLGVFVVNKFVLQHVCAFFCFKCWFYNMFGCFWGENVGFTACLDVFWVHMMV